jgi:signal transduction histidine kinase
MARTPAGEALAWSVDVDTDMGVVADVTDLDELLGPLLENAATWATSRVRVRARRDHGDIVLDIDDDGPGIPPHQRGVALRRGGRLGDRRSRRGTGLGLAIAGDVAAAYGGRLALADSDLGGLRVRVTLPAVVRGP